MLGYEWMTPCLQMMAKVHQMAHSMSNLLHQVCERQQQRTERRRFSGRLATIVYPTRTCGLAAIQI
jgi:hypothetical protein